MSEQPTRLHTCSWCKVESRNFRRDFSKKSGWRGICIDCEAISDAEKAKRAKLKTVMCGTKNRYDTKEIAITIALKRSRNVTRGLRTYECPFCHKWHLTSKT